MGIGDWGGRLDIGVPVDRQWRPYGPGLRAAGLPDDADIEWFDDHTHETNCGAPPGVEKAWSVVRASEKHAVAWRILLVMARMGHNLLWDILDAEQDEQPFTKEQLQRGHQAERQANALRLLRVYGCLERTTSRVGRTLCVWVRLTERARAWLAEAGVEPVASDWDRMIQYHDPQEKQKRHMLHCLAAARLARGRGWETELMPREQPKVDLRITPPGQDPIYVKCESRKPTRVHRRVHKWRRLRNVQGFAAVIATRPQACDFLANEIRLHYRLPCLGTDLETLIQDPDVPFWQVDDRQDSHYREQIEDWHQARRLARRG
ncbi:MAG: hypothetical protein F4Z93_02750 [Rhodospirillales bacterium]|nr:hypothetical protein [Rhodospirillales bacterium]